MINPERILAGAGEGIVVLDNQLRYVFINDAAVRIMGVARDLALGRTPMDLFPPAAIEHVVAHVRRATASATVVQYEAHQAGEDRWFENRIYPSPEGVSIFFADVTTRKRAEEALIQHRDMLSLAMRGGRMGAWSQNLAGEAVWWSRELEELFGLPPGGFAGTEAGFLAFVHPDDRRDVEAAVAQALRSGDDYVVEFRFRHANGAWMWMEGRGRALYDDDGQPRSLHGIGIDITERKAFEDQIAAARDDADADAERLSIALAAARLGDWSWDAASDIVNFSPVAAQIFGIPPGPHLTRTAMLGLLHPDDRERARRAIDAAVESHTDYVCEYRLVNVRRERWVAASGRCRYNDAGAALGMYGVVQDITGDRLLVRLDDAVRPLVDPEEITYTAASLLGQHLDVNRCAYATVEKDEDSFSLTGNYTKGTHSIVGRYAFRQFGAECLRLMRAGEPCVVNDTLNDPRIDGADRVVYEATAIRAVICVPVMKAGCFVAAMAVHTTQPRTWKPGEVELVQQVTSRCWESLERARVERERAGLLEAAEAANQAKDEFMAMLGHELRNPLSPILTALHLMKLRGNPDSERERTVIERQVNHLIQLVDDLLDVSRIARGKVELKREVSELVEIVASAIEVASPLLEGRRHTLTVNVARTGLAVFGDAARLRQVISNLLTNAAKYTPPGGTISITASHEQDEIILRVRDTGIGIPAEMLPRIFEMFVQSRRAIDRSDGGLGLGLTIVRNLVERHGGTVEAWSGGIDKGSEFVVRLPAALVAAAAPHHEGELLSTPAPVVSAGTILVVDDNLDAAQLLAEALSLQGHVTHVAHDGPSALRAAATIRFDTALLDIGLPVMDGYELAGRLRTIEGLENIWLIAVTGYGQEADRQRAASAGFDRHLVKPVDLDLLAQTIAAARGDGQEA
ncbi:MAG: PAS domain-containing protein [Vicinamibacterales bacterium]